MSLMPVACWDARRFGGAVVTLRPAPGDHLWRVEVKWKRPLEGGQVEEMVQTFDASHPCPIRAMHATVMAEISRDLQEGAMVNDASMKFFIRRQK